MSANNHLELFESLARRIAAGLPTAVCLVVSTRGSTPQTAGAMLLLGEDGRTEGTIGGGCVEAEVIKRAGQLLRDRRADTLTFKLNHDYGWDDGLICGGGMDVAVLPLAGPDELAPFHAAIDALRRGHAADLPIRLPLQGRQVGYKLHLEAQPTLLIAGAGHVGAELARLAVRLDFQVVVIDDRADLMGRDRLPEPIATAAGDIANTLRHWPIDANTYVVVVTRGHNHDEQALHAVIDSPARYLGMIGSRRKVKLIFDDLLELGVRPDRLEQVHTPIGLKIGAITVPEIAVSIAAELIQVRREGYTQAVQGPFKIEAG